MSTNQAATDPSPEQAQEQTTDAAPMPEPAARPLPLSPTLSAEDTRSWPYNNDPNLFAWYSSSSGDSLHEIDPYDPANAYHFVLTDYSHLLPY
ncbi:hypothetical protein MMC30_005187 [Trapelia coarctata]|nr:hypothetical protein [Trapelia coarctata]